MAIDSTVTKKINYLGWAPSFQEFDCRKELLGIKDYLSEIMSYKGEYYYLLGKTYEKVNVYNEALAQYMIGRSEPVVDLKVFITSKL